MLTCIFDLCVALYNGTPILIDFAFATPCLQLNEALRKAEESNEREARAIERYGKRA